MILFQDGLNIIFITSLYSRCMSYLKHGKKISNCFYFLLLLHADARIDTVAAATMPLLMLFIVLFGVGRGLRSFTYVILAQNIQQTPYISI